VGDVFDAAREAYIEALFSLISRNFRDEEAGVHSMQQHQRMSAAGVRDKNSREKMRVFTGFAPHPSISDAQRGGEKHPKHYKQGL
jgi:hypothetical protein